LPYRASSIIFNLKALMQHNTIPFRIAALAMFMIFVTTACGPLKGAVVSPPVAAADINLTDHNGQPFQLSKFHGKVALVFFGYTHCTAECPATMAIIRQALSTLGDASKDVVVVMVSTDPFNDTPQSMKEFLGRFNPAFIGLLGSPGELNKAWQDYGVLVEGGETHSSFTYVVDQQGNLRETFSPDTASDDIAADLKFLLTENQK
jgi:protein SCO1/2